MPVLTDTKYEGNDAQIYKISLTPDYAAAAGTAPTGTITSNIRPKITKGDREFGVRPRGVRLVRTIGTAPDTFKKYAFLPVLTASEWASATYAPGVTVTIGTIDYTVASRINEDY